MYLFHSLLYSWKKTLLPWQVRFTARHNLKSSYTQKAWGREASHTKQLQFYSSHKLLGFLENIMPLFEWNNSSSSHPSATMPRFWPDQGPLQGGLRDGRDCPLWGRILPSWLAFLMQKVGNAVVVLPGWKQANFDCAAPAGSLTLQATQQLWI